jgi:TPR repeat protein
MSKFERWHFSNLLNWNGKDSLVLAVVVAATIMANWAFAIVTPSDKLDQAQAAFRGGDFQRAADLFTRLAEQNNATGEYWLGHMTELGIALPRDPSKAIALYKQAAACNITAADLRLGEIYLHGNLAPPDFAQAKSFLSHAAYKGNAEAARLLGEMYRRGLGTPTDPEEAYAWSEVATVEGNAIARHTRNKLLYSLKSNRLSDALARADHILDAIRPARNQQT